MRKQLEKLELWLINKIKLFFFVEEESHYGFYTFFESFRLLHILYSKIKTSINLIQF